MRRIDYRIGWLNGRLVASWWESGRRRRFRLEAGSIAEAEAEAASRALNGFQSTQWTGRRGAASVRLAYPRGCHGTGVDEARGRLLRRSRPHPSRHPYDRRTETMHVAHRRSDETAQANLRKDGAMTATAWTDIARRAAEALGADAKLDNDVSLTLGLCHQRGDDLVWDYPDVGSTWPPLGPGWITDSLDVVVRLIKEQLPGKSWEVRSSGFRHHAAAYLWNPMKQPGHGADYPRATNSNGSAPLALLSAFALAMAAETGETVGCAS